MNKFNAFIEKRNFKKIFIIYIITAIICGMACAGAVGYTFKDKINFALQYKKASERIQKESDRTKIKQSIAALAASSNDIYDILLLDNKNNVMYSAKNSDFISDGTFELERIGDSKFLQNNKNYNTIFRFIKKDEFMLSAIFADNYKEIYDEYDEDNFYLSDFQSKELYMISLLGKNNGDTKAYIISSPKPVPYGVLSLKIAASIIMLLFMVYWIIVALWVYQNARKSKLSAPIWGIITLFTNLAGVFIYLIYKHISSVCAFCGAVQSKGNKFCTFCGKKIGITCEECGHFLKSSDRYCPGCGHKK